MNKQEHTYSVSRNNFWISNLARLAICWERLWPLLVPLVMIAGLFAAFSWAGGWRQLQSSENIMFFWAGRIAFGLAALWALSRLRHFRLPSEPEIVRRIENVSRLENRPMTAQSDDLAMGGGDPFAHALWEAHKEQMADKLKHLSGGVPVPKVNRVDPYALRAMIPILAFAAFFFSFSPSGGRLTDVYEIRNETALVPSRIDAWVKPPSYTRKPPIYLTLQQDASVPRSVEAPIGSEFFLRFVGERDVQLFAAGAGGEVEIPSEDTDNASPDREFKLVLDEDTAIRLVDNGQQLSQWGISVVPDQAPTIGFFESPSAALSGSLQLSYTFEDDYGVVKAQGYITPIDEPDPEARPLVDNPIVDLPLSRLRAKKGVSRVNRDLTEHPLAGSQVSMVLEAKDDRGQVGKSDPEIFTLPGRRFSNPLARSLVEQRRILALDANKQQRVVNMLDAVSRASADFVEEPTPIIAMRVAYRRLVEARTDDELRSTLDLLWDIALGIEYGDLSEAERRLREAQERLSEALERGASEEEIERLMEELRQAMNEMLQALAEQARNAPQNQNPFQQDESQTLTQNDLERMMDRIEDLARSGSQDAARQLLNEMQRMMDNLRAGRQQQQRQAEGNQLNQTLDKLSELMQQQQELMNETFRMQRQQEQFEQQQNQRSQRNQRRGNRQQGQQQQGQQRQGQTQRGAPQGDQQAGEGSEMTAQELREALENLRRQQEQLQQQLSELGQQLEELGLGQPQELGEAQNEMGEAQGNLGQGDPGSAATDQGQALDALRRGAQNMMQQMAGDRQQGGQQNAEDGGQGQAGQRRGTDPLGRQEGNGLEAATDVEIPGEIDAQRARRILEAIRKRLAIPENPLIEKDYLERLLRSE